MWQHDNIVHYEERTNWLYVFGKHVLAVIEANYELNIVHLNRIVICRLFTSILYTALHSNWLFKWKLCIDSYIHLLHVLFFNLLESLGCI